MQTLGALHSASRRTAWDTCGFVIVHADPVQLKVTVAVVSASGVDAMLVADHLPKLRGAGRYGRRESREQKEFMKNQWRKQWRKR